MPKRGRYATLPEKMHQCMYSLLVMDVEVPKHVRIRNVCLWMSFVAAIHAGEFDWVANKEDRQIIEDEILVAIFGEEPHGPSTHITDSITRTFLTGNGRDSLQNFRLLPNIFQKLGVGQIAYIMCNFEFSPSPGSLCMDAPIQNQQM